MLLVGVIKQLVGDCNPMLLVGVIKQLVGDCNPDASGSRFEDFSSSPDASRRSSDFLVAFLKLLVAVLMLPVVRVD